MTHITPDISLRQAAIVAGVSILIMGVAAVFATGLTMGSLMVPDDAAATFNNIKSSEMVFRSGIFSWLVILICDVLAAWGLYIFLKPVNSGLSLLTAWFRLVYVALLGTALLNYLDVLVLLGGDDYQAALGSKQLQARVMLLLHGFNETWSLGLVVFGIHILLLGYLVYKSGYIPKIWGILLILAFLGYVVIHLGHLLLPNNENLLTIIEYIFILPMVLGEVGLAFWLLIKGIKVQVQQS